MNEILSVAQLVSRIKYLLESNFRTVNLEGEISNLSSSSTGHWYFTLSDESSSVSVALFRADALRNPLIRELKDGDQVIVSGPISVYQKRGTFQILAKKILPKGKGNLKLQYEQLKSKLAAEGLFDVEVKKKIPLFPQRVAVITALKGAALQDFLNVYGRRSLHTDILVIPALVQGDGAPESLRKALFMAQKYNLQCPDEDKHIDLIVLTRGGGSFEDLWSFNDEGLAYDIFNCEIPTISAVGHQVDFSISDFVADLRCETPTAAAEIITQYQMELKQKMLHTRSMLINSSRQILYPYQSRLSQADPQMIIAGLQARLSKLKHRLVELELKNRAQELVPVRDYMLRAEDSLETLVQLIKDKVVGQKHKLEKLGGVVNALGPQKVLERGYSYLSDDQGHIIASSKQFKEQETSAEMIITFHDGSEKVYKGR